MDYIQIAQAFTAVIPIPGSLNTDTVTYVLYKASDNSVVSSGSMTFVGDEIWKMTFTPAGADVYILKVNDDTISSKRENIYKSVGTVPPLVGVSPSGIDLTTIQLVKSFLHITDTNDDDNLQTILTSVSKYVSSYCGRDFISATFTEYFNGDLQDSIALLNSPVTSITSIHDDTARGYSAGTLVDTANYAFYENGIIELDNGVKFSVGKKNVKVVYVAGYAQASIPYDLQLAVWRIIQFIYRDSQTAIAGPEQLDVAGMIMKFRNSEVREILDRYRRIPTR